VAALGWFAFVSARWLGFDSTGLLSTDSDGVIAAGAEGSALLVNVGCLAPNESIANFDAAAPAAKQITALVRISAAFKAPHPRRWAGGGALILDGREVASQSAAAEEPSRFQ
jgi:hypothetical protein